MALAALFTAKNVSEFVRSRAIVALTCVALALVTRTRPLPTYEVAGIDHNKPGSKATTITGTPSVYI
jgi:hypothetical protein